MTDFIFKRPIQNLHFCLYNLQHTHCIHNTEILTESPPQYEYTNAICQADMCKGSR